MKKNNIVVVSGAILALIAQGGAYGGETAWNAPATVINPSQMSFQEQLNLAEALSLSEEYERVRLLQQEQADFDFALELSANEEQDLLGQARQKWQQRSMTSGQGVPVAEAHPGQVLQRDQPQNFLDQARQKWQQGLMTSGQGAQVAEAPTSALASPPQGHKWILTRRGGVPELVPISMPNYFPVSDMGIAPRIETRLSPILSSSSSVLSSMGEGGAWKPSTHWSLPPTHLSPSISQQGGPLLGPGARATLYGSLSPVSSSPSRFTQPPTSHFRFRPSQISKFLKR